MSVALRRAMPADAAFLHALRAEPSILAHQPIIQRSVKELEAILANRAEAPRYQRCGRPWSAEM